MTRITIVAISRGNTDGFVVTEKGRPFLRAVATEFDSCGGHSAATHSTSI